jgi:endonuclease/exonuclease/phosphatase family metal-dependent hydrolase
MRQVLGDRANPVIVVGDFNSGWVKGEQELQALTRKRNLRAYLPDASHLNTYSDARLDWILISEEFIFCKYYNSPDVLSDHLTVISEIVSKETKVMPEECVNEQ